LINSLPETKIPYWQKKKTKKKTGQIKSVKKYYFLPTFSTVKNENKKTKICIQDRSMFTDALSPLANSKRNRIYD